MSTTTAQTKSSALARVAAAPSQIGKQPRRLSAVSPRSAEVPRYVSPLRYPGAKAGLANVIGGIVESAAATLGRPGLLVEPFAGGASTSLRLAIGGAVDRVLLSDADPLVARFWQVAAADTEWLIDRLVEEPVTLERWDYWRAWKPTSRDDRDVAVKCLFLNRTTFSGILHGRAGPIGGRQQSGAYTIDCRFNKDEIAERLRRIGALYEAGRLVDVWCKDWAQTLRDIPEWYPQLIPDRVIAYLDPPYLAQSPRLYGQSFDPSGGYRPRQQWSQVEAAWHRVRAHYGLSEYLRRRAQCRWILSYDMDPRLLSDPGLYAAARMTPTPEERDQLGVRSWYLSKASVELKYTVTATEREASQELVITTLPGSVMPWGERLRRVAPPVGRC